MHDSRNIPVCRVLSFGPFMLDPARRRLEKDGVPRRLCKRAMDVLLTLISRPLEVVSAQELMAAVWPFRPVDAGCLRIHIDILLKVLSDSAATRYIADIAGRGFSFMAPVGIAEIDISHCGMVSGDVIANVRFDDRERILLGCLFGMTRTFSLPDALVATLGTGLGLAGLPATLAQLVTKSLIVAPAGGRAPTYRIADIVRARLDDGLSAGIGHEPQLWRLSP
jgi:DNA-binding winged helix-turn-helix (wHTH) protein